MGRFKLNSGIIDYKDLNDDRLHGLNSSVAKKTSIPNQTSLDWRRVSNVDLLRMTMLGALQTVNMTSVREGITKLKGIVLRHEPMFDENFSKVHRWINWEGAPPEFRSPPIKVRIPEVHGWLPPPSTIGRVVTEYDNSLIDLHTTFVPEVDDVPRPTIGSVVWVGWENMKDLEGPLYYGPVTNINAVIGVKSSVSPQSAFFKKMLDSITKTNIKNEDEDITLGINPRDIISPFNEENKDEPIG